MPSDQKRMEPLGSTGPFKAYFNDGKTAASAPVTVNLTLSGLVYRIVNSTQTHQWDYARLKSIGPVVQGSETQVGSRDHPGAILFVEDPNFARSLLRHAPHLSERVARRRLLVPMLAISAVVVLIAAAIWLFDLSVARSIAELMPADLRQGLGRQVVRSLGAGGSACQAGDGEAALAKMVARLGTGVADKKSFDVSVAPLGIINAFAAPGEQIVVSAELLQFVKSPEELAGIIAHEMGHGLELDPEAGIVRAVGISAAMQLLFGGDAGQLGELGGALVQLRYTRNAERRADDHAIAIMRRAGIAPRPFASFFERVQQRGRKKSGNGTESADNRTDTVSEALKLLRSHPAPPERSAKIAALKPWPSTPVLSDGEWKALRAICE